MRLAPFRLAGREDESLYSVMARWLGYLGDPPIAHVGPAIFGTSLPIYDDLPVGMARLENGGWLQGTARDAVLRLSLYPYYAAFASEARREAGMRAMLGDGPWPHAELGSWRVEAMPPERLRFCASCLAEMLVCHPDPWWRRAHQLPTVLVCPDHAEVLIDAPVGRKRRRQRYVPAMTAIGAAACASVKDGMSGEIRSLLAWMAVASRDLLSECHRVDREGLVTGYRQTLAAAGVSAASRLEVKLVATKVIAFWRPILGLRPDWMPALDTGRWMTAVLAGSEAPPLHHLLLRGFLERG